MGRRGEEVGDGEEGEEVGDGEEGGSRWVMGRRVMGRRGGGG